MKICQRIIWLTGHPCIGMSRWVQQLQFRDTAPNELAWENGEAESIKWTWGKTSLVQLWETENTKKNQSLVTVMNSLVHFYCTSLKLRRIKASQPGLEGNFSKTGSRTWPEHCPPLVCFLLLKKEHLHWWIDVTSDLGLTPRSHTGRSLTNEHKKIVVGRCIKFASANIHQLTVINRLPTWET